MTNNIQWTAIEHSQSKLKNKHIMLVAFQPMGGGMNKVCGVVPLYDLRDQNLNGSVSLTEIGWAALTKLYDPYHVFKLMNTANETSCVVDAASELRDYALMQNALVGLLEATHKVCSKALTTLMVQKVLGPGIKLNLANTGLAELGKIGGVAQFIVQTTLEAAIIKSICATHN